MAALSGPLIVIRYRGIATAGIQVQRHGRLHHDLRPGKDPLIRRTSSAGQAKQMVATVWRSRRRELRATERLNLQFFGVVGTARGANHGSSPVE
jgi:hypothetical protein